MNPTKTMLAASAATSLFAAAGAASATIVGTGASVSGTGSSFFVIGNHVDFKDGGLPLTLIGTATLDDTGTYTATSTGSAIAIGFGTSSITATESFTGSYNSGTGVFTPTAGKISITSCTGAPVVCAGATNPPNKAFNTGVGGSLTLVAGGTLTGTALQPSSGTVPPVTSFYTFVVGPFTPVPAVALPPAAWLLGSGLLGLVGTVRRRRRSKD